MYDCLIQEKTLKLGFLFLLIFRLCLFDTFGQSDFLVKGLVSDEEGLPIDGVNVSVKSGIVATTTDANGFYTIRDVKMSDILIFSHISYKTLEQSVNSLSTINVTLIAADLSLNQVVVVGYGTQKKITVTGALSSVAGAELAKSPTVNLAQSLVGRTPGLIAQQNSGQPGNDAVNFRIRGTSTFDNQGQPLILVDGVERPFNSINADEVENITVLKDASTTAVYGIRGANGVVLVTTKRGLGGKPQINVRSNYAIQKPTRLPELLNAYDYAVLYNEAIYNDNPNQTPLYTPTDLQLYKDGSDPIFHPDIDWFDYMMEKSAPMWKNTVNINGGGQFAKYFVSMGYLSQGGLWKEFNKQFDYSNNTTYRRYNFRSNIDFNLSNSTVLGLSLGGFSDKYHTAGNPFGAIQNSPPGGSPAMLDDKLILNSFVVGRNPLIELTNGYDERFVNQFNITVDFNQKLYHILKGLLFRSKLAYDSDYRMLLEKEVTRATFYPLKMHVGGVDTVVFQQARDQVIGGVSKQSFDNRSKRVYFESALQYNNSFFRHSFGGLLLFNLNKQHWLSSSSYSVQYPDIPVGYLGVVGRFTYNFGNRYLFEVSIGRNGSENFPKGRRFGTFPAVSIGWNVTREPILAELLKDKKTLSLLKFTASYGETGNDRLISRQGEYLRFMYFPSEYTFENNRVQFGEDLKNYQGILEGRLGNPEITWEKAVKRNVGVELGLFEDRLNARFDYFTDDRNNILYQKASIAHVAAAIQDAYNIARIKNRGLEAELSFRTKIGAINFGMGGNYTFARNRVIENGTPESPQNQLGNSLNQIYGLIADGIFNTQAEVDAWLLQYASVPTPGDIKYIDSNKDGKVDQNDFVPIGYPTFPEVSYGFNANMSFKGFDFSILFQGADRVSRMLGGFMQRPGNQYGSMLESVKEERWTAENTANAKRPKLTATYANANNYVNSTIWIRDASYLRLKNVELGYNIKSEFLRNYGLQAIRLYVSGQNLITWDNLKIVDPEQQASNSYTYPQLQVYNVGINVQF